MKLIPRFSNPQVKSLKINVISQQKVQNGVKSVNNVGICQYISCKMLLLYMLIIFSVIWIFYIYRVLTFVRIFICGSLINFTIFWQLQKDWNQRPAKLSTSKVIFNTLWSKVFDKKKKRNYKIHLSPSLVISVRLPIVSGISGMSLCWRSSDVICTQFPISAHRKGQH